MSNGLYFDLAVCFLVAAIGCVGWSYRKHILKQRWKETVAASAGCGFMGFLLYLMLRQVVPAVGLPLSSWLSIPATALAVWIYYDVLFIKGPKQRGNGDGPRSSV